ncbi:hypothetical protein F4677DRAFT_173330 [Hypoxylon crocopeplum]|nr:hypothetical protein F4677DRAFT_173330 [Hypoxylon crocopeplum]
MGMASFWLGRVLFSSNTRGMGLSSWTYFTSEIHKTALSCVEETPVRAREAKLIERNPYYFHDFTAANVHSDVM